MDNNTRRYPRTLEEAFGPYARGGIYEHREPMQVEDKVVIAACSVIGGCLIVFALVGWLP